MSVVKADDADHDDGRIDVVEIPITRLLVDEEGDARHGADDFRDDEVGPRPAEQDAHVRIDVGDRGRDDDAPHQTPSARAERLRRLDQRGIDLAHGVRDDQHLLEKRPDEDDRDLRPVIDTENGDAQVPQRPARAGSGRTR